MLICEARGNYGAATERRPLVAVIKVADGLASHILERTGE